MKNPEASLFLKEPIIGHNHEPLESGAQYWVVFVGIAIFPSLEWSVFQWFLDKNLYTFLVILGVTRLAPIILLDFLNLNALAWS
jgi:hypothetical protein